MVASIFCYTKSVDIPFMKYKGLDDFEILEKFIRLFTNPKNKYKLTLLDNKDVLITSKIIQHIPQFGIGEKILIKNNYIVIYKHVMSSYPLDEIQLLDEINFFKTYHVKE